MKDERRTASSIVFTVVTVLLVLAALSGCGVPVGERVSSFVKSRRAAPTATALPPTVAAATTEPSPTSAPPTPLPPSPTASPTPTRTPTLTPSVTPTPAPDAVVTADALTLRGGPGTVYARLGTLPKGDPLTVTARTKTGDWLAVMTKGGKSGWVAAAYVTLNLPLEKMPVAVNLPPTPVPPPTRTPTPPPTQPPAEGQPAPASPTTAPTAGPSVDDQIAGISRGQHGQLPQPVVVGSVAGGGEAELTIVNDTPYVLTVLIGSPNQATVTLEKCPACSIYSLVGPPFCQEEGRSRQTIRVKPGTMKVAARVDNPSVIPFSGEWTLNADNGYFNCFFIVTR